MFMLRLPFASGHVPKENGYTERQLKRKPISVTVQKETQIQSQGITSVDHQFRINTRKKKGEFQVSQCCKNLSLIQL